jgi:hypothetical protein
VNDIEKRKVFQQIKSMSAESFWSWFGVMTTRAYVQGIKHTEDAMSTHKRISRPMIDQVLDKVSEVRELWDGIHTMTIDTEEQKEIDRILTRRADAND